jgi:hypothetical protein
MRGRLRTRPELLTTGSVSDPIFRVHVRKTPSRHSRTSRALHRAALLRPHASGVALALLCAVSAGGVGGVHLRRPADSRRPGGADAAARSRVGGVYEPLVVTPAIGVRMEPEARILPLDGSLAGAVTVHTQAAAEGTVTLELPAGWTSQPAEAQVSSRQRGRHRADSLFRHAGQALRLVRITSRPSRTPAGAIQDRLAERGLHRIAAL